MPFFTPTKIYSRQQGNTTFDFYVSKDKQLISEAVRDGKTQQMQVDIPHDFQSDLDVEKISKLRVMFDQCYFGAQFGKILVSARGLGGWGEGIHKGYEIIISQDGAIIKPTGEGTYKWTREAGFQPKQAKIIADACQVVDDNPDTSPYNFSDQSWHFDPNNSWDTWATSKDPRMQHVYAQLNGAIGASNALNILGYGLHALQDMFAHTPDFAICPEGVCFHGFTADNTQTEPTQRFEYTKTATLLYLQSFLCKNSTKLDQFLGRVRLSPPRLQTATPPTATQGWSCSLQ